MFSGLAGNHARLAQGWLPEPLRARFWIPLVAFMILSAIGLEIALHYCNLNLGGSLGLVPGNLLLSRLTVFLGWATFYSMNAAPDSKFSNYYHYAYVGS